jgi:hypothetical protein
MATELEEYSTEEQRSVVRFFLWAKGLDAKNIHQEMFMVGSVCRVKRFATGSRNSLKDLRKLQMMTDQVRKWLREQPKDFYAADFDVLVYQCLWRICREINVFPGFNITCFTFYIHI